MNNQIQRQETSQSPRQRPLHARVTRQQGNASTTASPPTAAPKNWFRSVVMSRLGGLVEGRLVIVDESGTTTTFGTSSPNVADAQIQVRDDRFFRQVVLGGSLGAAESYLRGQWETDDLVALIQLFAHNYEAARSLNSWSSVLTQKFAQLGYWLQRNTRKGSQKNIAAHYDLGNDFYKLFLDRTMTYSSGVFQSFDSELSAAQVEKYDRICRKLQLRESDRVVEIGCGWGGFAIHAATNYGCHITATTISKEQHDYTRRQIDQHRLGDRIELVQTDYRDLTGSYDKLVSIEMIEAVGYENLNAYFSKCASLLTSDGLMTIQAITIPDQRFASYRRSVDYIQRYVFPGGFLPSLGAIQSSISAVTDLRVVNTEDFAQHYAETLSRWSDRFEGNLDQVRGLACLSDHDIDRFIRLWRYYLAYCEAGFRQRMIGLAQLTFAKPDCRIDTGVSKNI